MHKSGSSFWCLNFSSTVIPNPWHQVSWLPQSVRFLEALGEEAEAVRTVGGSPPPLTTYLLPLIGREVRGDGSSQAMAHWRFYLREIVWQVGGVELREG